MAQPLNFKTENGLDYYRRLEREAYNLIDARLLAILLALTEWAGRALGISIIITCLARTKKENDKVGGSPYSAHLFKRGVDIRCKHFTEKQIKMILAYLERTWGHMLFVLRHGTGSNDHIHINIRYAYRKPPKEVT